MNTTISSFPNRTNETVLPNQRVFRPQLSQTKPLENQHPRSDITSLRTPHCVSSLNLRVVSTNYLIRAREQFHQAAPLSAEQKEQVQAVVNCQVHKIRRALTSSLLSPSLRDALERVIRDTSITFIKMRRATTAKQVCALLKSADERISTNIGSLLALVRPPLVAKFEARSIAIYTYIEKEVNHPGDVALPVRKIRISEALRTFDSEGNFENEPQEFQNKWEARKRHLTGANSEIQTAQTHERIDALLVDLFNKIKMLDYPLSPERHLLDKEIFSIPDDLFHLRRDLGESIFRPSSF